MIIYIRHSFDDNYDPTYEHDPKLTKEGKILAYQKGKHLIKKFGIPNIIYCSPFRRTKETVMNMIKNIPEEVLANIKIFYDPIIGRYFSHKEKKHVSISKSTLKSNINIYETKRDFNRRINILTKRLSKWIDSNHVIWCITHTSVFKKLAKLYNIKLPRNIPFMYYFVIEKT